MALHPYEISNALNALDSLETDKIKAVESLEFWGKRLRYVVGGYQVIDADHPRREYIAAGVRSALAHYQKINREISQARAE